MKIVKLAGVPPEIRNSNLPNTSHKRYRFNLPVLSADIIHRMPPRLIPGYSSVRLLIKIQYLKT
jgi:hypothetical protein